ncbi:4Fe-4S dicluster domain-containing protein [Prosthecochloris sp. N3]|uniref:4Fe-4S dicluster domain-containing protein n=1 Tax=Prosthecochloris ethylica TaxID=2743976 RepID=A0ABR9XQR4_9CHLB|nr:MULTISPECIES: 4Fe-4S dicluster domain-containing protein [Prosthecochloris]MEC9486139.1 4Fe-4S dicluster domain-containing protein [Prosthecochloris sp.]MBF0586421.1 4Fe-4S dicluster domain-containing protein [Prosthecochloris ethylica]MBF0636361.1 4Fe-4S dicluster domain-containing protein [Prosthecochloris ethylica]NUK47535.1 4Fe-4S dicluster domain-containing protein [Prosthecochloris ethylica]RNA64213.1 4Fe-4S dicluster domain-containing protein [Prosthecochloris sp. ZM_2]
MADPVKQQETRSGQAKPKPKAPAAKAGAPKDNPAPKPKGAPKQGGSSALVKERLTPLDVNLGRTGRRMESALPTVRPKPKAKPAPKPAPKAAAKGAPKGAPAAKGAAKPAPKAPAKGAPPKAKPAAKKKAPRAKKHYFILENLCVGCGLCLDKCPPKVNAIGYKFYGDVQEGGFRCYIDQDACISCSACFSSDECPSGALVEILPSGEVLDFTYTPPERLDFDLRFLHRFHREPKG